MHPLYDYNENIQKHIIKNLGTYIFIVLHVPSWSFIPCGDYCSPLVLIYLKIWVHVGGSKISAWRNWIPCNLKRMFFFQRKKFFLWSCSSLDKISTLWGSHYTQDPLNNDNSQLTALGFVPSIGPLWENGHNTKSENFIFKYMIVSLK